MKKRCLIYANCQGNALGHFLKSIPVFDSTYQMTYWTNYVMIQNKENIPIDLLKNVDLFIYQPIRDAHGVYSTRHFLNLLPERCICISFPYIFNDALWPLFRKDDDVVNKETITDLLAKGASTFDLIIAFLTLKIDFRFKMRFDKTMQILAEKEKETDVKVSQYILEHYKSEKLFLTFNHPTSSLLIHCADQILKHLQMPAISKKTQLHPNAANLAGHYPQSPYERSFYQFEYQDDWKLYYTKRQDANWRRFYLQRILEICLKEHCSHGRKRILDKFMIRSFRSLAKYFTV